MTDKNLREKYRLDVMELGQCVRGVDSLRSGESRSPDFWSDVDAFFNKRFEASGDERDAKKGWFSDIMKFVQRHGRNLIAADYIRSHEGTVSMHEDLMEALVGARLLDEPDEEGSLLDQQSVIDKLDI